MKISKIEVINYRRYRHAFFEFGPNINIICGNNALGKSTILEAIQYLIMLRSFKASSDFEIISFNKEESIIKGLFFDKNTQKNAIVLISKHFKKMNLDGCLIKKASEYIGFADVVSFGTEDVEVISGSPSGRRKMIDVFFSQYDNQYMKILKEYKNLLKERNSFLKDADMGNKNNIVLLQVIDGKLATLAEELTNRRDCLVDRINEKLQKVHFELSGKQETCTLSYAPSWQKKSGIEQLNMARSRDFAYKTTTIGPHRDEFIFRVDGNDLSKFGSQGQKKTTILSFKMCCVELLKEKKHRTPIVLLDDVFGELDSSRHNSILRFLEDNIQTIITTPSLKELDQELIDKANIIYLEKEEV